MSSLLLILLSAVAVNLVLITREGVWAPIVDARDAYASASAMVVGTLIALPLVTLVGSLVMLGVLQPLQMQHLRTLVFVLVTLLIAPVAQFLVPRLTSYEPARPGFLLLLITNCAVLGVAVLAQLRAQSIMNTVYMAIAAALAFALLLLAMTTMWQRLRHANIPSIFREAPFVLVTAGIAALACMGFTGLIQE
jgi:electron transport complex protein RnfA